MLKEEIQRRIKQHEGELRTLGVQSLELFGSAARGQQKAESDVDLLVTFNRPLGYFGFFAIQELLEKVLESPNVDLVPKNAVIPEFKEPINREAVSCL